MKFVATFKTPDVIDFQIERLVEEGFFSALSSDNKTKLEAEIRGVMEKFVNYGEIITIQFDTKAQTAVVIQE